MIYKGFCSLKTTFDNKGYNTATSFHLFLSQLILWMAW